MEENSEIDFQNLFVSKIRERGFTLSKLSELSGIALKHLQNLNAGRFDQLPSAPYFRGYLIKLGRILDFDGELWWEKFKEQGLVKGSGASDELPKNRFAQEPINKKIIAGAVLVLLLLYLGFRFSKILGRPTISITYPDRDTLVVEGNRFLIQGSVKDANELFINGEVVAIGEAGLWQKEILLDPGVNSVTITAKKFLGRQAEITRKIIYEAPEGNSINSESAPSPSPTSTPAL